MKASGDKRYIWYGMMPIVSCRRRRNRESCVQVVRTGTQTGFTLLEVIVSLIIVAVALTTFIQLMGNSALLRVKMNDHHDRLDVAVTKAEEAFLGLLDGSGVASGDKNRWQGTNRDTGVRWRVEEEKDESDGSPQDGKKEIFTYTVFVEGVELSSIRIQ